jgi:hypothetical protein
LFVLPWFIHKRILKGELKHWYVYDAGIPVSVSLAILGFTRWLMPLNLSYLQYFVHIGAVVIITFGVLALTSKDVRVWGLELFGKIFSKKSDASIDV